MKVLHVKLTNFKLHEDLEIDTQGRIVYLVGSNETGKSSIWQAIEGVLKRKGFTSKPITRGKDKGAVEITIGEEGKPMWRVISRFTENKPEGTLEIKSVDNDKINISKPVAYLKDLLGDIDFDVDTFLRSSVKDKADVVKRMSGLDFTELDKERKEKYEERTGVNRQVKELEVTLKASSFTDADVEAGTYAKEKTLGDILDRVKKAGEHNAQVKEKEDFIAERQQFIEGKKQEAVTAVSEVKDVAPHFAILREKLAEATDLLVRLEEENVSVVNYPLDTFVPLSLAISDYSDAAQDWTAKMDTAHTIEEEIRYANLQIEQVQKWIDENPKQDAEAIQAEAQGIQDHNRKVLEMEQWLVNKGLLDTAVIKADSLTQRIEDIDKEKDKLVREAKLPVEGLGFDENGLTLNGLPFDEKTQSRSVLTIAAVKIYLAMKPLFACVYLDATFLDKKHLAEVDTFMRDNNLQGFLEKVADDEGLQVLYEIVGVSEAAGASPAPEPEGEEAAQ
jgi:energy-coupling factor transporter ATP-binding protein EcfA2